MEEIKFRAKSIETNRWVSGSLIWSGSQAFIIPDLQHATISRPLGHIGIKTMQLSLVHFEEANQGTIGQFTGIKDRRGIEIFEGDIILRDYGQPEKEQYQETVQDIRKFLDLEAQYEVIGNEFDTPELLAGE